MMEWLPMRHQRSQLVGLFVASLLVAGCSGEASSDTTAPQVVPSTIAATTVVTQPEQQPDTLSIPAGAAPVIDGRITAEEWAGAALTFMDDGTELSWMSSGGYLYLGVRADAVGSVNLLIATSDQVRVFHSSAALGSATYEPDADGWALVQDFSWCCRSATDADSRRQLLADEGWQANIGFAGEAGEVEFQVAMSESPVSVAVSYVRADGSVSFWPDGLDEDAQEQLYGIRRDHEQFSIGDWVRVEA
jgi:hypothetical protein